VDERRHASKQAKEDGSMPHLGHLENLSKPVNKWSERVPQAGPASSREPNPEGLVRHWSDRVPQTAPSCSREPNPEGLVRHRTTSSGGVASPRSNKPRGSPSPNPLRKILGSDHANQKTRFPSLDVSLDLLPGLNQMASPFERSASAAGDVSPRVPETPKSKPARRRFPVVGIMACHEGAHR